MAINFTGNVWSLLSNAVCLPRTTPCLRWSSLRWWGQGRRRTRSGGSGMQWVVVSPQYALTKQGGTGLEPCVFVRIYGWRSLGMRLYLCTMVNTWCIIIIIIMIVMHQAIAFVILELFGANQNKEWQSRARRKGKGSWLFHIPITVTFIHFSYLFMRFVFIRFSCFLICAFLSSALKSSTGAKHNLPAHLRPWRYTAVLKFAGISEPRVRAPSFWKQWEVEEA